MSAMSSQITGVSIVCSTVFQAQIKGNINVPRQLPLWGESTGDRWIPLTKGQLLGNLSIWWRYHDFVKYYKLKMNIKQTNNGVFQIRETQILESRMI